MTQKKGMLVGMKIVSEDDELMIISEEGVIVRTPVKGISELGRATQGVRVMNINDGDRVTAVAVTQNDKKRGVADGSKDDSAEETPENQETLDIE